MYSICLHTIHNLEFLIDYFWPFSILTKGAQFSYVVQMKHFNLERLRILVKGENPGCIYWSLLQTGRLHIDWQSTWKNIRKWSWDFLPCVQAHVCVSVCIPAYDDTFLNNSDITKDVWALVWIHEFKLNSAAINHWNILRQTWIYYDCWWISDAYMYFAS